MIFDIIIVGSGIAGLATAIKASKFAKIAIITKSEIKTSNTWRAQGGLAAAVSKDDNKELHYYDTLRAGDGICNKEAVKILTNNAPEEINWLIKQGIKFNKTNNELTLSKEAVHSRPRIVHHKDTTGQEIINQLSKKIKNNKNIKIFENNLVIHLIKKNNQCIGLTTLENNKRIRTFNSKFTILASGGAGQIYQNSTNPETATGDGVAIAYRAKAKIQDMEFFQFHPTGLYNSNPMFLISETLRGEGGLLVNKHKKTFMENYHRDGQMAPRDVVSKFSVIEMQKTNSDCIYLDITNKPPNYIKTRFPNIYKTCLKYNIDITQQPIPVTPVAHYMIGGIKTNTKAQTTIDNLYALGEVSCNGLHGADRLASNSLPEGLVFGTIAVDEIKKHIKTIKLINSEPYHYKINKTTIKHLQFLKNKLQKLMWNNVGIIRKKISLKSTYNELKKLEKISKKLTTNGINKEILELRNLILVSQLITLSAMKRKESRGTHFIEEFPNRNDKDWIKNIII